MTEVPKLSHDPIEDDPALKLKVLEAERIAEQELGPAAEEDFGYCHLLWAAQKRILLERFGVAWSSPAEMNPDVLFD